MKAAELRELSVEELARKAAEMRENLFNLKIRHAAGTLDSSADLSKTKRDLARVMTVLTEKAAQLKAQAASQQEPAQPQAKA
jgi:large subunit ribosomal protein L29